jgi:nucleoside-diphosphate-sugar epimerase
MIRGEKILVTGPTSQVGWPVVRALAPENEVHGVARFGDAAKRERLEAAGVRTWQRDLAEPDLGDLPSDFDRVLNFAVVRSGDFDYDLAANAEGAARLLAHCAGAKGFLHCSSAAVYEHQGQTPARENDPLGDNHRVMMPTYSLTKIAAEATIRFAARQWNVPTVIARLSVPYGDEGGWPWYHLMMMKAGQPIPIHADGPNLFNPIHEDDITAMIPRLLEIADVPATVVNWGGSEAVSIEDWCAHLGTLTGLEAQLEVSARALGALPIDVTRMHERIGETRVPWREGIRRMVASRNPELLRSETSRS